MAFLLYENAPFKFFHDISFSLTLYHVTTVLIISNYNFLLNYYVKISNIFAVM